MAGGPQPTAGDAVSVITQRKARRQAATISTSSATASTVRFDDVAAGVLVLGGLSTAVAAIVLWASDTQGGPYGPLRAADGSPVAITTSTTSVSCHVLPDAVRGCHWLRLVSDADPGTAATATITMKS